MLGEGLKQLATETRDLRRFGLVVGGVFLLLGGWFLFRHRPSGPYLLAVGGPLVVLGLAAPRVLRLVYLGWMLLGLGLGLVMSGVLLSSLFLLVITPIGLAARLLGKDFLRLKGDRRASIRKSEEEEDYEEQL